MSLGGRPLGDSLFRILNTTGMLLLVFITLFPFWYSLVGSLNQGLDYMRGGVAFWPRKPTLANYAVVLRSPVILSAYRATVLRTIVGTFVHLLVTSLFAYAFSRRYLMGKRFYATAGVITMFFSGGLIPTYLLYKTLGLLDNFLVYIVPAAFNFWNVIIFGSFFRTIPEEIHESAKLDGAHEYRIWFRLVLPLSKPVLAALALFTGVWHWNDFFISLVFTTRRELEVIQLFLLKIVQTREMASQMAANFGVGSQTRAQSEATNTRTIQLATMVVTSAPILVLYPLLQKYFVKGVLIGSIKG
jgi:putative aldouronate transport system permease protein